MLLGRDLRDVLTGSLREMLFGIGGTLMARPLALDVLPASGSSSS